MRVLVCGGAGYIGSHACVALAEAGHEVVVFDNLSNSSVIAVERVSEIIAKPVLFVQGDIRSREDLEAVFERGIDAVVHCAARKVLGESYADPLGYYDNNISGTISLLQAMKAAKVERLVFSSSAAVYGVPDCVPVAENAPLRASNPYARSKLVMEQLIADVCAANAEFSAVILRYFNPVSAHSSGRIGEASRKTPANLMPHMTKVAIGAKACLEVFGDDFPTRDGTGVRDYLHVVDLATAHVSALNFVTRHPGPHTFNLGAGRGYSVLELLETFVATTGRHICHRIVGRRAGDIAELWADPSLARDVLGWEAKLDLARMCSDAWRWERKNPNGYLP